MLFGLVCFALILGLVPLLAAVAPPFNPQEQPAVADILVDPSHLAVKYPASVNSGTSRATTAADPLKVCPACSASLAGLAASDSGLTSPRKIQRGSEEEPRAGKEKGARWKAGKTSVSGLSLKEKRELLGLKGFSHELSNDGQGERIEQGQYPDQFDWREYEGDWATPIRDQEGCGSCWAFSALAALEAVIDIEENDPDLDMDLSEQFLLSFSEGDCDGWYIDRTLDFLRDVGTPDEACFPYQADDTIPGDSACPDWQDRAWRITDWGWVAPEVESIRAYLVNYGPLVTGMLVYEDFYYYTGGVYEHLWGRPMGLHAVTIVGYDDEENYWICKNSWGTGWGEDGWFRIGYGEAGIENETAYIEGSQAFGNRPPNTPISPSPSNHATDISIDAHLSWTGGDPDPEDTVAYDVYFGTSTSPPLVSDDQASTAYDLDTLGYNTKYYWQITASDNHGASTAGALWDFTTESEPPPLPHAFYGNVTIGGEPAPVGTVIEARGTNVITGIEGNPITTTEVGEYGSLDPSGPKLLVQGDIQEGEVIEFYVNGVKADQTFPFASGEVTHLNLTTAISRTHIDANPFLFVYTGVTCGLPDALTNIGPEGLDIVIIVWGTVEGEWVSFHPHTGAGNLSELVNGRAYVMPVTEDGVCNDWYWPSD